MEETNPYQTLDNQTINEEIIAQWEIKLKNNPKVEKAICIFGDAIIQTHKYNNDEIYLKVLRNDVKRTRVRDIVGFAGYPETLEKLLMLYCETNLVEYRQGMNEIMGPLLLLNRYLKLPLYRIYNIFTCFIQVFMTNYYVDKDLYALRGSLDLLPLLLKYHEPEIAQKFTKAAVSPHMYGTNWLLTTYANKNTLEIIFAMWHFLIEESDELMIYYIISSFIHFHKSDIIAFDVSQIPEYLCQMLIKDKIELKTILDYAVKIREATPISFSILVDRMQIFKPNCTLLKELYKNYSVANMISFPVFPSEALFVAFRNILTCPDPQCANFKNTFIVSKSNTNSDINRNSNGNCISINKSQSLLSNSNKTRCYQCQYTFPPKNYVLIDLRILNLEARPYGITEGILPMTKIIENNIFLKEGIIESIEKDLIALKDNYHFILLTTSTNHFEEYESKFCPEKKLSETESYSIRCGLQEKKEKELNEKEMKKYINKNKDRQNQLKEYELLKTLLQLMEQDQFPYVSFVYGGYSEIHELSLKYSIPLLSHVSKKCSFCKQFREKQSVESKDQVIHSKGKKTFNFRKHKVKQINQLEVKIVKLISLEMFTEYSKSPAYKLFNCFLIRLNLNEYITKDKIILIVNKEKMILVKLMHDENNKLLFPVIEIIDLERIAKIIKKNNTVTIGYYGKEDENKQREEKVIEIDLMSTTESLAFCAHLQELLGQYL